MRMTHMHPWQKLEQWSPWLFGIAAVCLLVGLANNGLAYLYDGYGFNEWLGLVLELGRLAALLGTAGLSVQVLARQPRLGQLGRAVASLAVVAVTGLIALATLKAAGILADPIGSLGLIAYVLSVGTFLLVGGGIVRTGAHCRRVGGLLLANVIALLAVFFGRLFVPFGLIATLVPSVQVLLYLSVGHVLRGGSLMTQRTAPATETTP